MQNVEITQILKKILHFKYIVYMNNNDFINEFAHFNFLSLNNN